jgi:SpoVK/Ycf46/Vps4 family AAA+-type ATPase
MKIRLRRHPLSNKLFAIDANGKPIPFLLEREVNGFEPGTIRDRRKLVLLAASVSKDIGELGRRLFVQSIQAICRDAGHAGVRDWRKTNLGRSQFKARIKAEMGLRTADLQHFGMTTAKAQMAPPATVPGRVIPKRNKNGELSMALPF